MAQTIVPTVLVTGSPGSGKSSLANTLRHLSASRRGDGGEAIHVVECKDDQVEYWVRKNKAKRHILCIYLLNPCDFPLLQPPTTAFDNLLRLRALSRPESSTGTSGSTGYAEASASAATTYMLNLVSKTTSESKRTASNNSANDTHGAPSSINPVDPTRADLEQANNAEQPCRVRPPPNFVPPILPSASTSQRNSSSSSSSKPSSQHQNATYSKRESGALVVLPVISKADCYTTAGLARARKDCLEALRDDWVVEEDGDMMGGGAWDWGVYRAVVEGGKGSSFSRSMREEEAQSRRKEQRYGEEMLWNIINPDWEEASLKSWLKAKTKTKTKVPLQRRSSEEGPRNAVPVPVPASILQSQEKGKEKEFVPGASSSHSRSRSRSPSPSPLSSLTPSPTRQDEAPSIRGSPSQPQPNIAGDDEEAEAEAGAGEQEEEEEEADDEFFTREYPWGRCYPLKPSHSDLRKVIKWAEDTVEEMAKESAVGRDRDYDPGRDDMKVDAYVETDADVDMDGDVPHVAELDFIGNAGREEGEGEDDACPHSPCLMSNCSGDHCGEFEEDGDEGGGYHHHHHHRRSHSLPHSHPHLKRDVAPTSAGKEKEKRLASNEPYPSFAASSSSSAAAGSGPSDRTAIPHSEAGLVQELKDGQSGSSSLRLPASVRTVSAPVTLLPAPSVSFESQPPSSRVKDSPITARSAPSPTAGGHPITETISTPTTPTGAATGRPVSPTNSNSGLDPDACGSGPCSLPPGRRSRTPHPLSLSLDPEDLPNGPPPPPLLSPSGRRWPGAPASTTGLADDSYPNSHPRSGFMKEMKEIGIGPGADKRLKLKTKSHFDRGLAQTEAYGQEKENMRTSRHDGSGFTKKDECEEISIFGIGNRSTDNNHPTGVHHRHSPSSGSTSSVYSHTHQAHTLLPANRIIALEPAAPAERVVGSLSIGTTALTQAHISLDNSAIPVPPNTTAVSNALSSHLIGTGQHHNQQPLRPPKPRKPKAQLACTFCRTRKLRCAPSAKSLKSCGECEKRGIDCEGPSEREVRKRREMEQAQATATSAPAASTVSGFGAVSGAEPSASDASGTSSKDASEGNGPLRQAVQPKPGQSDQPPYITGQLTDLGVIHPVEASEIRVRREGTSGDRDGDGHKDSTARDVGKRALGPALDTSQMNPSPTAGKGNGNSGLARASARVASLDSPAARDEILAGHQYHHYASASSLSAPGPPPPQAGYHGRQHPSFFPSIQPKQHMSQQPDRGRSPSPKQQSYERGFESDQELQIRRRYREREEEGREYYARLPRDRPPSRGYSGLVGHYPAPSAEQHELYGHGHPSRYLREGSPPLRHSEYGRRPPSPPPGSMDRSASLTRSAHHHYAQHPPAVPSQNSPSGSLQPHPPPYAHPSSHPHAHISHGRSHSHSHPRSHPYMPGLTAHLHSMGHTHPHPERLPSHLPPPPGAYTHIQSPGQPRGVLPEEYIASMNKHTRRLKEEQKQKNPSSRSGPKVVACNHCRARKTRCDGETPCSNCRKRSLSCQYQLSAREAARRKRVQAADLASRVQDGAGPSSIPDSPRSIARTNQASPVHSRASSIEGLESGGFASGSPGSVQFSQSYQHGASLSPVLHRVQQTPSASTSRAIHLAPVSTPGGSHSPGLSLPPIASLTSPPNLRTPPALSDSLHSGTESLKRPRSPDRASNEEGDGSTSIPSAAGADTSQSQSKRMRVDALID